MKVIALYVSKYSTLDAQTVVIKTEDGQTVEVDLFGKQSLFMPNTVRVKTHSCEWGFNKPQVIEFGYPED